MSSFFAKFRRSSSKKSEEKEKEVQVRTHYIEIGRSFINAARALYFDDANCNFSDLDVQKTALASYSYEQLFDSIETCYPIFSADTFKNFRHLDAKTGKLSKPSREEWLQLNYVLYVPESDYQKQEREFELRTNLVLLMSTEEMKKKFTANGWKFGGIHTSFLSGGSQKRQRSRKPSSHKGKRPAIKRRRDSKGRFVASK